MIELLPVKASFATGDEVAVEARGLTHPVSLTLWHLAEEVGRVDVTPEEPVASFGVLAVGGYGIEAEDGGTTALDVLRHPLERLRYGFLSDFSPDRETAGVADNVRRLHLNAVQFYDWMYRHADLLPPQDEFADALGRVVSISTVEHLAAAISEVGSVPVGYAAVYAAGVDERAVWEEEQLLHPDGSPWKLADFLWIVDPASPRWLEHFTADLRRALERIGFGGFHLDQYGEPKRARRRDGSVVDLAAAFVTLVERVRASLPDAVLIFNNVNDFPTEVTARTPQDATYIEPWSPNDDLRDLAWLARKAAASAPSRPVVLASYLSAYQPGDAASLRLLLATVLAHGAVPLLFGEEDAILVDPYYVRHARLDTEALGVAKEYLDFAVRYGELLFDAEATDVTRTHTAGINHEIGVEGEGLWPRVTRRGGRQVVSLVDLAGQDEPRWDAPKRALAERSDARISFERVEESRYFFAAPESAPRAVELAPERGAWHDTVNLPPFTGWCVVWADPAR